MPWPERSFDPVIELDILTGILGRELLIQHLGHWPTFHDFEVVSISLERAPWLGTATSDLRATFYVFDLHQAPDAPERKQAFAELLFEGVEQLKIDGFNHQNPIAGMSVTKSNTYEMSPSLSVRWGGSCLQHEVSFLCSRVSVLRVIDLNPFRRSLPVQ